MPLAMKIVKKRTVVAEEPSPKKRGTERKAKPAAAKRARENAGRFLGAQTGLSVTLFQNRTLEENFKRKLSDEDIARMWRDEFPNAIATYTVDHVRGVRSAWNRGKHGNEDNPPKQKLPEFDENRQPLPLRGEGKMRTEKAKAVAKSKTTSAVAVARKKKSA